MLARWILLIALSLGAVPSLLIIPTIADQEVADQEVVVLLHGLGRTSRSMASLENTLSQHGYHTVNIGYPSTQEPIEQLAEYLENELRKCCKSKGPPRQLCHPLVGGYSASVLPSQTFAG